MRVSLILLLLALPALPGDGDLERRCAELSTRIEKLLGPKFREPVPVRVVDGDFIVRFAAAIEEQQVPKETRRVTERFFARVKLVPGGFDLMKAQLDLLRSSVAGLYDPDGDCFYIVGSKAKPGTAGFDVTAAHELAHAYRDVDKDYWKQVLGSFLVDEDKAIAISCLVEGDAQLIGEVAGSGDDPERVLPLVVARSKKLPDAIPAALAQPALRPAPLYLREMLITRYLIGQAFAARVYEKGGWAALDRAFDAPPVSTEQILHPEKYIGPEVDAPTRIEGGDPAAALGAGWKTVYRNSAGEFFLRVLFTAALGRKQSTAAAEGWDGGRYFVCEKDDAPLFAGLSPSGTPSATPPSSRAPGSIGPACGTTPRARSCGTGPRRRRAASRPRTGSSSCACPACVCSSRTGSRPTGWTPS
jgi:hypothetical protein